MEVDVVLPVVHAPFRVYYAYNWLRLDGTKVTPPQNLPSSTLFPNQVTYDQALQYFAPIPIREQRSMVGFTVARQI